MKDLRDPLGSIEATVGRLGRKVIQLLRPGLRRGEIESLLEERGFPQTQELVALYEWRDGTDTTTGLMLDDLQLVPGFYLLSLEDALTNYDAFTKSQRWNAYWLPILANGGGDFLTLDTSDRAGTGLIRHFRIEESEHPIEYGSLADMLATFAAAYERGVFFVDGEGYLETDDNAYAALAAELNPHVSWWAE